MCTKTFNIPGKLYNGHIDLNYTCYFVYRPLNSYFIHIGYWTLNIYIFFLKFLRGRFIETNKNYIQDSRGKKTLEIQ